MSDIQPPSRAEYLRLGVYLVLAFLVAFSWLGLGYVTGLDPGGFAIDASSSATTDSNAETVAAEDVREALKRTNRGGQSTTSVTAIWATDAYFAASDVGPDDVGVDTTDSHVFVVFLNTHTGQLAQLDWMGDATILVDGHAIEPIQGKMIAGGYHHGTAVVAFPKTIDGGPTIPNGTDKVTLSVVGLERVEPDIPNERPRNVTWEYPPPYYDLPPSAVVDEDCNCTTTPNGQTDQRTWDAQTRGGTATTLRPPIDRETITPPNNPW